MAYHSVDANAAKTTEPFPSFDPNLSSSRNDSRSTYAAVDPHSRHDRASSLSSTGSRSTDLELDNYRAHSSDDSDEETALDRHAQLKRKRQRSRAQSLGGRMGPSGDMRQDVEALGHQTVFQKSIVNGTLIGLWYLFSVSISVYNKWMFADKELNFHFPLFTTSFHMIVQFTLSSLVLILIPRFRPGANSTVQSPSTSPTRDGSQQEKKPLMTPWFYSSRIAPCAAATGLDIGLGNTSLRYVTLTFFTMCKSSTLGFVLGFAILFRLEKLSWKLAGIIAVMTLGVVMMVAGETSFSSLGFVLLMMASLFSGLRWSLTQILLRRNPATSNPFASLFFLTPIMFLVLIVIAIPVENIGAVRAGLSNLAERKGNLWTTAILLTPGVLAFLMTSSEFALLKRTSVVTLSVCGIFKEVITIGAGGVFFEDQLTAINISGLMVTIVAIAGYNYLRMTKMKRKAARQAQELAEEQAPMLSTEPPPHDSHSRVRSSTGDMIRHGLKGSADLGRKPSGPAVMETPNRSPLVKLPENVE